LHLQLHITEEILIYDLFNNFDVRWNPIASNGGIISKSWIGRDEDRIICGLIWCAFSEFSSRYWGKPRKFIVRIADIRVRIWNLDTCHVSDCEFIGPLSALGVARTT
jgi:hypothetical protein